MVMDHPNFGVLGARIAISNHQKNTEQSFLAVLEKLANNRDVNGELSPLINEETLQIARMYESEIDEMIQIERDYLLDFFGFKTLERSYLLKAGTGNHRVIVERPQHLFMRVAIGIHGDDMESVKRLYDNISLKRYTHATPTLFNAGLPINQLASCFLMGTEDSIEGIFGTITECAQISKWSGGIGVHISNIRAKGSYIRKTAGISDGILPMLKVYNDVARYINQGGGKRNGSFAMYLEVFHADIFDFLDAKKNIGSDEIRARDLFYSLWVCDLFMEKVEKEEDWYLMCPNQCPGLSDVYGEEFNELYMKYVSECKYIKKIKARDLWKAIIATQVEVGVPYIAYKDSVNRKTNQSNIGTIKSSNLCCEIMQISNQDETSVCNLASICLPSILKHPGNIFETLAWRKLLTENETLTYIRIFEGKLKLFTRDDCVYCKLLKALLKNTGLEYDEINAEQAEKYRIMSEPSLSVVKPFETVPQLFTVYKGKTHHIGGYDDTWQLLKPRIDHQMLYDLSYELIENLNKVIDKNFYPIEKTRVSNMRHRPTGLGVQGLGDLFMQLKLPFDSDEARVINKEIFETMYFGAMNASCDLAKKDGPYSTFEDSPLSRGNFQFNLWGMRDSELSEMWDWGELRDRIKEHGVRNSLLIALMPTASTSQIMGSIAEAFEPITSNLYARRTLAGEFTVINPYLVNDLIALEIWNEDTKNRLQYDRGSVQNIKGLPKFLKDIYRTAYEVPQKSIITMSAERGPFVCQSQSLNLFFEKPDFKKLTAAHFLGWKSGLKTGSYYIRSKPAVNSQRFGMDITTEKQMKEEDEKECLTCSA